MLAEWLAGKNISAVFLVPGLQLAPCLTELCQNQALRVITATHELTSGYMADGYARATGKPGVCLSIGAAGTAGFLAAAVTAKADQSPVLFITSNVPATNQHAGAFQDGWAGGTDDQALLRRAVGFSACVFSAQDLEPQLDAAFTRMLDSPQQPAHLIVPLDVQKDLCAQTPATQHEPPRPSPTHHVAGLAELMSQLASARRVLVLAGSRLNTERGARLLRRFAETFQLPVATNLAGKGLLPEDHPLSLGNFGFAGSRRANESLLEATSDLLLALGSDLNERDTLGWDPRLRQRHRRTCCVDAVILPEQHPLLPDWQMAADVPTVLEALLAAEADALQPLVATQAERSDWIDSLRSIPQRYQALKEASAAPRTIAPDRLVGALREQLPPETILVVDAGLHRLFAGHYWLSLQANAFFSACGLAPLGWAIAAAIGIKLARPGQPVVVLTGDGCMQAHGNELATMARFQLPILVIVCNNSGYGSIQRRLAADEPAAALTRLAGIDWTQYAEALGCPGRRVENLPALLSVLATQLASLRQAEGAPLLLEVNTTGHSGLPASHAAPGGEPSQL